MVCEMTIFNGAGGGEMLIRRLQAMKWESSEHEI